MPDVIDAAQELEIRLRDRAVRSVCNRAAKSGRSICVDCEGQIEAARLVAMPSACRCIECQKTYEGNA
tara:strand:+ start:3023 stop:3226 length:204 start_codon:yes stop_codon:yes gene_type:complete